MWKALKKGQTDVISVTMQFVMQAIYRSMWQITAVKGQTIVTSVTMHLFMQSIYRNIWKRTAEKGQTNATSMRMQFERSIYSGENLTNATSVIMNLLRDEIWRRLLKYTVGKAKQMQPMWLCLLWIRLFEETFERAQWRKTIKCNLCDFASLWANALTKHMKMHIKVWHKKG